MILRPYQETLENKCREAFKIFKRVCVQLATGAGKTAFASSILSKINENKKIAWFISPRVEITWQASDHLSKWKTPHGIISPGRIESRAYLTQVVSKDTLLRRWDKIKQPPDFAFIDECHINYDFQLEFVKRFPDCKIIGLSATVERLDGRGLSVKGGGIYDTLIQGPSIPWLTERDYLTPLRYFSPPLGLENLKRRGYEYDKDDLAELLRAKKVYGKAIKHYRENADGKSCLVFCRDVKSAYETAHEFCTAGYKFFCVEGKTTAKERKQLIKALSDGEIHGLTGCDLFIYGLDIPRVEVGIGLRPTLSRAYYFQMIGRVLRPFPGKEYAMFFDHVDNLEEHRDPAYPKVPLHYLHEIDWNFDGTGKRKRVKIDNDEMALKICPSCFLYFDGAQCPNCGASARVRKPKTVEQIDIDLVENKAVALKDRPPEEKREMIDRINTAHQDFQQAQKTGEIAPGAVGEMIKISIELGYPIMWVYWKFTADERKTVNVPLLYEIARQKKYNRGWAWFKQKDIKKKIANKKVEVDEFGEAMGVL